MNLAYWHLPVQSVQTVQRVQTAMSAMCSLFVALLALGAMTSLKGEAVGGIKEEGTQRATAWWGGDMSREATEAKTSQNGKGNYLNFIELLHPSLTCGYHRCRTVKCWAGIWYHKRRPWNKTYTIYSEDCTTPLVEGRERERVVLYL